MLNQIESVDKIQHTNENKRVIWGFHCIENKHGRTGRCGTTVEGRLK